MFEHDRLRVLCFGNPLHGDDGLGAAVSLSLRGLRLPLGVRVIDCGTRSIDALGWFEHCPEIIVVDAMSGEQPGHVHEFRPDQFPVESSLAGAHAAGLGFLLASIPEVYPKPPKITVIAVEIAATPAFNPGLSLPVAAAVGHVVEKIRTGWAASACAHECQMHDEVSVLRQANQALEQELSVSAEAIDLLISEQESRVDELKRQSDDLQALHGALDRAIETMAEIFVLLDANGRVSKTNRRLAEQLGYQPDQLAGRFFEHLFSAESLAQLQEQVQNTPKNGLLLEAIRLASGRFESEVAIQPAAREGLAPPSAKPYLLHATIMYSRAGKLDGAVITATDISLLKAREHALQDNRRLLQAANDELRLHRDDLARLVDIQVADLRQAKEQAEAASRAKSDFLSNMSHEVRTPLNAILGMTELALRHSADDKQHQQLNKVHQAAGHLLTIINDVLDFSRIEAGKMSFEHLDFDLPNLVEETCDLLINRATEKNLELVVDLAPDVCGPFNADALRIKQVLINLLGNAIKFSSRGTIRLSSHLEARADGDAQLHFSVADQGIGIAPEYQEQVFSAFTQADTSTTRRFGGSGLGLAISRRIVELMGGQIQVVSAPGQGSTFRFSVRVAHSATQITASQNTLASMQARLTQPAARSLMIASQNTDLATALARQASLLGLVPQTCTHPEQCVALGAQHAHTLAIVVDRRSLPVPDAWAQPGSLLPALASLPVIVLDTPHPHSQPALPSQLAAAPQLAKPSTPRRLYNALAAILQLPEVLPAHRPVKLTDLSAFTHLNGLDVLVVDDVEVNRDLMTDLLSSAGLAVRLASNGQEALTAIELRRPDIVLMDCQMPVMDGFTATRHLRSREDYRTLPVIALTAGALEHDREASKAAGMNAHVTKPVVLEELLYLIDQLLPERRAGLATPAPVPPPPAMPQSPPPATVPPSPAPSASADLPATTQPPTTTEGPLPPLPGVDVALGLASVRNREAFYRKMLVKFRDTYLSSFATALDQTIAEGKLTDALRMVHSLKGSARSLGIMQLGDLAAQVEAGMRTATPPAEPPVPPDSEGLAALYGECVAINRVLETL